MLHPRYCPVTERSYTFFMNIQSQRKYWAIGLLLSMLLFVLQFHAVRLSNPTPDSVTSTPALAVVTPVARRHKTVLKKSAPGIAKTPEAQDFFSLHLKSNLRDYNYILSGRVLCGTTPCPATMDLTLDTSLNPNMRRTFETMNDGTYFLQVPITEVAEEQVDWRVSAHNSDAQMGETHGRHILTEDAVVAVEANLVLR